MRNSKVALGLFAVVGACLAGVMAAHADPIGKIVSEPLTPNGIKEAALPSTTQKSAGLDTTGVGMPVYLELEVTNITVTNVSWTLPSKPLQSSAALSNSPLTNLVSTPIFDIGDRNTYFVPTNLTGVYLQGRAFLRPDAVGEYVVVAEADGMTTDAVPVSVQLFATNTITAGTYIGCGSNGACMYCHGNNGVTTNDNVAGWQVTYHSDAFTRKIDGGPAFDGTILSNTFKVTCYSCHTVGYDTNTLAVNDGFDDIQTLTGWTSPATTNTFYSTNSPGGTTTNVIKYTNTVSASTFTYTNIYGGGATNFYWYTNIVYYSDSNTWNFMPSKLQDKANIQCEDCHGPASQHYGNTNNIAISVSAGVCASCHGSTNQHITVFEWQQSGHGSGSNSYNTETMCCDCHSTPGFIDRFDGDGKTTRGSDNEGIACAACHDPHPAPGQDNEHMIRVLADVRLGEYSDTSSVVAVISTNVYPDIGLGQLCMQCHKSRHDAATYAVSYHSYFGPHYGPQTDMLAGKNAVEYDGISVDAPANPHMSVPDSCVQCHMQNIKTSATASYSNSWKYAQGHTMKMETTGGVDIVQGCLPCHYTDYQGKAITNFDFSYVGTDYDTNGVVEGVQTEIDSLCNTLAALLPPVGPKPLTTTSIVVTSSFTTNQLQAAYNYYFVVQDGSHGVHNAKYAAAILKASISNLTSASSAPVTPPTVRRMYLQLPSTGQVVSWIIDTNGTYLSSEAIYGDTTRWTLRGVADMDGDGVADLIWQYPTYGQVACWLMNTNGTVKSTTTISWGNTSAVIRAVGDLDGDGANDLILQNSKGQITYWLMNTNLTIKAKGTILSKSTTWALRAAGDVDNNKAADLFVQSSTGPISCWLMNTNMTIKGTNVVSSKATSWKVCGAGDINGDGMPDLAMQMSAGQTACWFLNTNVTVKATNTVSTTKTSWQVRGVGVGY